VVFYEEWRLYRGYANNRTNKESKSITGWLIMIFCNTEEKQHRSSRELAAMYAHKYQHKYKLPYNVNVQESTPNEGLQHCYCIWRMPIQICKVSRALRQSKPILYVSLYLYPNIEFCKMTERSKSNFAGHIKDQPWWNMVCVWNTCHK
jgi:hypothetical protein